MKTLGPGTRVFIGWTPDRQSGGGGWARCTFGVVIAGPLTMPNPPYTRGPFWQVLPDIVVEGRGVAVHEQLLTPIDDDDGRAPAETVSHDEPIEETA